MGKAGDSKGCSTQDSWRLINLPWAFVASLSLAEALRRSDLLPKRSSNYALSCQDKAGRSGWSGGKKCARCITGWWSGRQGLGMGRKGRFNKRRTRTTTGCAAIKNKLHPGWVVGCGPGIPTSKCLSQTWHGNKISSLLYSIYHSWAQAKVSWQGRPNPTPAALHSHPNNPPSNT